MTDEHLPLSPRRSRTRERLLDAACCVFAEQGVQGSAVEEVCECAGFSRGAFYSNFSTKEELFAALVERQHGAQLASLADKIDELRPRLEVLTGEVDEDELAQLVLEFLTGPGDERTGCLIDQEFRLMALRDPEVAAVFAEHQNAFESSLLTVVGEALRLARRSFVVPDLVGVRLLGDLHRDLVQRSIREGCTLEELPGAGQTMVRLLLALTRHTGPVASVGADAAQATA